MPRSPAPRKRPQAKTPVAELYSLGPASSVWLNDVGIHTYADLIRLGSVAAYKLVKAQRPGVSRNLLYALESALRNQAWNEFLTAAVRRRLTRLAEEDER